jgi:hypothetical protein
VAAALIGSVAAAQPPASSEPGPIIKPIWTRKLSGPAIAAMRQGACRGDQP